MKGADHPFPARWNDPYRPLTSGRDEQFHKVAGKGDANADNALVKILAQIVLGDLEIEAGIRLRVGGTHKKSGQNDRCEK